MPTREGALKRLLVRPCRWFFCPNRKGRRRRAHDADHNTIVKNRILGPAFTADELQEALAPVAHAVGSFDKFPCRPTSQEIHCRRRYFSR